MHIWQKPSFDVKKKILSEFIKHTLWEISAEKAWTQFIFATYLIAGVSNPAPEELPSCIFQLQPQSNTPEPANQGVQGYLIITDRCVGPGLELKSVW